LGEAKTTLPMSRTLGKFITGILMLSSLFGPPARAQSAQTQALVQGNNVFAFRIYGQLRAAPGNLFFSPYSISTCLAMTYAGARGETEQQMARVFHFPPGDQAQVHSAFGDLQRQLAEAAKQGIALNIANALWAEKNPPLLPAFLQIARTEYQANVNQADFRTAAEPARAEINQWVAHQTKDKIQEILPPGSIDAMTRMVLANAIYFKATWLKQFEKGQTQNQPFHVSGARQVDAPLMHHMDEVRYMEETNFQAVELPYTGGELAMVILLPRQVDGCAALEDRLNPALLPHSLSQSRKQKVEIFLPRFKLESKFELQQTLAKMGMPNAFGTSADFSGMDGTRNLFISAVFHKVWGEVNEEGTEAAAATAVTIKRSAIIREPALPPVFRADHPFLFFIRDTRSGSLLFMGRLANPVG
jgi:serine protease inhibitor